MLLGADVIALVDDSNRNDAKPGLDMYLPWELATDAGWTHAQEVKLVLDQGEPWVAKIGLKPPNKPYLRRPVFRAGEKASLRDLFLAMGLKDKDQVLLHVDADYLLRFERVLQPSEQLQGGTGIKLRSDRDSSTSESNRKLADLHDELAAAEIRSAEDGDFDPENFTHARELQVRAVVHRRGPGKFRKKLIEAYDGKCAFTGCDCIHALEAAHIVPYGGEETNHASNGLLLRADIHTLFDLGMIGVDTEKYKIIVSPELLSGYYSQLQGQQVRMPSEKSEKPSKKALDLHRERMLF